MHPWRSTRRTGPASPITPLALDPAGRPHISYFDNSNRDLRYAQLVGGAWETATVDGPGFTGQYTSLALDDQGAPHISYYALGTGLKYAAWDGAGWEIVLVEAGYNAGQHTSIVLDSRGIPHIASQEAGARDLHYAVGLLLGVFLPLVSR
jgi:hypothetical protein